MNLFRALVAATEPYPAIDPRTGGKPSLSSNRPTAAFKTFSFEAGAAQARQCSYAQAAGRAGRSKLKATLDAGRTDMSPPGVDLAAEGFPPIGGRLDLIQGKPIPALVYRAGKHLINVFVLPVRPGDFGETLAHRGYMLRYWNGGDIGYRAVCDASPDEFGKFERACRAASDPQPAAGGGWQWR
jgi:hypothetical protein